MKVSETLRKPVTQKAAAILLVAFCINHDFALSGEPQPGGSARTLSAVGTPAKGKLYRTVENAERGAGMSIHLDPETGAMAKPPSAAMEALDDRGIEDLEFQPVGVDGHAEVQSTTPDGGYMVHLKGRYVSPLEISRHLDGRLTIQHRSEPLTADLAREDSEDTESK